MSRRTPLALLVALALMTAGCGSSGDANVDASPPDSDPPSAEEIDSDEDPTGDTASTESAAGKAELTASAPGVTETAIRIGVMSVDTEELADLGVVINSGDIEGQWRAFVDAANADGGVLGRQLEPHFVTYSALSDTASEEACVELTEDIEVFWVGGSILRDNPICFTGFHETIAFSAQPASPEAVDRAVAPFRSLPPSQADQAAVFARASNDAGLYGDGPVGVIRAGADPAVVTVVADALRAEGLEVIEGTINASLAVDQETAVAFERFRTEGVETVVLAGIGAGPLEVAQTSGYDEFDFALSTALNPGIIERQGLDPGLLDGVFSVAESLIGTADQELLRDDPAVQRCVGIYEKVAGPGTVEFDPTAELANLGPTLQACDLVDTLVAVATAAGPVLDNVSFGTALDAIGDLDLATVPFASSRVGKFGLSDTAIPVRYDGDLLLWALEGDEINTAG
jgi:hypothetical protein